METPMIFFRIKLLSAIFILFTLTTLQNLYSQDYPESLDQKKYNFLHNYTLSFNLIGGLGGIKGDLIEIEKDSVEYEEMDANGKIQKKNPDCNPYYYGFITDFYPLTYTNLKLGIRGKISRTKIRKEATISGTFGKKHIKKTLMRYNSYMLGVVSIWTPFNNQNIGLLSFFNYGFIYNGNLTPFPGLLEQNEDSLPKKNIDLMDKIWRLELVHNLLLNIYYWDQIFFLIKPKSCFLIIHIIKKSFQIKTI